MKFLTEEWASATTNALNENDEFKRLIADQNAVLKITVPDAPHGETQLFIQFQEGRANVGNGPSPTEPDLVAKLDYATNVAMSKGELSGQTAAMTGKMEVSGDMEKLINLGPALDAMSNVESTLGIEY